MYNSAVKAHHVVMSEITVSDARARLADVVDSARVRHDPVYLTRRGRRVAAVIDADDLDALVAAAEDLADIKAAADARDEMAGGEAALPWDQVKADLGLA
jgi:prevent-host-death family protein